MNQQLFNRSLTLCGPELDRRAVLCEECMSETCVFCPEGICMFPLLYGRKAEYLEDYGCKDSVIKDWRVERE